MNRVKEKDPEKRNELIDAQFDRKIELNENDYYIEVPVSSFRSELFRFFLEKMPIETLEFYGLENGMKYPNFKAVRSFLNKKFNFNIDNDNSNSPLKDL
jgi:hypothetical protein